MIGFGNAAGFVLVGGRSSRMGADKALMPYRGLPMAGYIADQLSRVFQPVSLVGDPGRYSALGYPVVSDDYPGAGPLGAVISALRSTEAAWNVVVACDLPGVTENLLASLIDRGVRLNVQAVAPITPDGQEQVLCAAYRRDALPELVAALESGETRLQNAVRRLKTDYWPVESAQWPANLNTPEDWALYVRQEA